MPYAHRPQRPLGIRVVLLERRAEAGRHRDVRHERRELTHHRAHTRVLRGALELGKAGVHFGVVGELMACREPLDHLRKLLRLRGDGVEGAADLVALELLGEAHAVLELVLGVHLQEYRCLVRMRPGALHDDRPALQPAQRAEKQGVDVGLRAVPGGLGETEEGPPRSGALVERRGAEQRAGLRHFAHVVAEACGGVCRAHAQERLARLHEVDAFAGRQAMRERRLAVGKQERLLLSGRERGLHFGGKELLDESKTRPFTAAVTYADGPGAEHAPAGSEPSPDSVALRLAEGDARGEDEHTRAASLRRASRRRLRAPRSGGGRRMRATARASARSRRRWRERKRS